MGRIIINLPMNRPPLTFLAWVLLFVIVSMLLVSVAYPLPDGFNLFSWQLTDVRRLQPVAESPAGGPEIAAAYARTTGTHLEFRLDFVDLSGTDPFSVEFTLEYTGGERLTLQVASDGKIAARYLDSHGDRGLPFFSSAARIDRGRDALVIRLPLRSLPSGRPASVSAGVSSPVAGGDPLVFPLNEQGQTGQARLLLAFWDNLPAATPAQLLRRWDGAHAGPYGQSHGLSRLLTAAQKRGTPIVLLDLMNPESLAGLDAFHITSQVVKQPNLVLTRPFTVRQEDHAAWKVILEERWAAYAVLPAKADFIPYALAKIDSETVVFTCLPVSSPVQLPGGGRAYPIPEGYNSAAGSTAQLLNNTGPTREFTRRLVQAALSPLEDSLLTAGGSLPRSAWGDEVSVQITLETLNSRPWVKFMDLPSLAVLPARMVSPLSTGCALPDLPEAPPVNARGDPLPGLSLLDDAYTQIRERIRTAPPSVFTDQAQLAFLTLTAPASPALAALHANSLSVVDWLLAAARWEQDRSSSASCQDDLDQDGLPECVLSNDRWFAILEPDGGRLAFAAAFSGGRAFEVVGPRSQFALGLTDPSDWRLERGPGADPAEIPGVLVDSEEAWSPYLPEILNGEIRFTSSEGTVKRFSLPGDELLIEVTPSAQFQSKWVVALDPLRVANPDWATAYSLQETSPAQLTWSIQGGPALIITASGADLTAAPFNQSRDSWKRREDPNLSYPPGHFVPFPLLAGEISARGPFTLQFRISP